jgi:DNA-binding response OmpR family regulator
MTIVVLDDDLPSQGAFRAVLKSGGFDVVVVETADEAVEFCRCNQQPPPDLLIADVCLPGVSGVEAAVRVRSIRKALPILFTSGTPIEFCSDIDRQKLARLPRNSYSFLEKPFHCNALLESVTALLNSTNSSWEDPLPHGRGSHGRGAVTC